MKAKLAGDPDQIRSGNRHMKFLVWFLVWWGALKIENQVLSSIEMIVAFNSKAGKIHKFVTSK